jgi:hypothetical protein
MNAGVMAGVNLDEGAAANHGKMKNHWRFNAVFGDDEGKPYGITFGVDPDHSSSVGSNEAQRGRSSGGAPSFGFDNDRFEFYGSDDEVYSSPGSESKPPMLGDDPSSKPIVSHDTTGAIIVNAPASIRSADGGSIRQRAEGNPQPGVFNIEVSARDGPSNNAFAVFIIPIFTKQLTFGDIVSTMEGLGMFPFFFRKLDFAIFGCRDFM